MMTFAETPLLVGEIAELHPLRVEDHDDLVTAVRVGDLWRTWYARIPSPDAMAADIQNRLVLHARGQLAPWAIVDSRSGSAVGVTNFLHLDPDNRRLEIGGTWIGRSFQATGLNPAAKFLLLERAFESLACVAVEFRTHWHNRQSRAAIAKLGAKQDGVLRQHQVLADGSLRDTVVFSILDSEWPSVRAGLLERLSGRRG